MREYVKDSYVSGREREWVNENEKAMHTSRSKRRRGRLSAARAYPCSSHSPPSCGSAVSAGIFISQSEFPSPSLNFRTSPPPPSLTIPPQSDFSLVWVPSRCEFASRLTFPWSELTTQSDFYSPVWLFLGLSSQHSLTFTPQSDFSLVWVPSPSLTLPQVWLSLVWVPSSSLTFPQIWLFLGLSPCSEFPSQYYFPSPVWVFISVWIFLPSISSSTSSCSISSIRSSIRSSSSSCNSSSSSSSNSSSSSISSSVVEHKNVWPWAAAERTETENITWIKYVLSLFVRF
jgi:hypothetical protein